MMPRDLFDKLPLFKDLDTSQREVLRPLFLPVNLGTGEYIFEQGDPAEYLYLVISGEVTIRFKPDDGPELTVTRVGPGGVVGWSAALGSEAYTSGAVCSAYSQLARLRGNDLRELCRENPEAGILVLLRGNDLRELCRENPEAGILVLDRLAWVIAERLRSSHDQILTLLKRGMRNGMLRFKEV